MPRAGLNETTAPRHPVPASPATDGTVTGTPRRWLRLEAVTLVAGALIAYSTTDQPWWLIPLIVLVPDVVMAGYLGGTRLGAITYNLAHSTPLPAAMIALGWWRHEPLVLASGWCRSRTSAWTEPSATA